jgi:pimeloyl-ACP methyl ester carboxylesterase
MTLVLLHEGLGCVALWRDVPERLAATTGCGVFAYSRFGYGQSDPQPLPWKLTYMQDEAHDILPRVLDEADIRDAVLVGHSDGASIAAIYAGAVRDRRLRGVVLLAAHFFIEDSNIASIAKIRGEYREGPLRERLARYHRDPDIAFHGWCDSWLNPGFRHFDITGCVPEIEVPILGLQGAADPYGSDEQLLTLQRLARAPCEIAFIKGAYHSPHLEAKDDTIGRIEQFIGRLSLCDPRASR